MNKSLLVKDIGERGLLELLQHYCPQGVVGDDGAILATTPSKSLVVTTDVLVDGVHFSDRTTSAFDVGWRAAAANLSDLAAMGASPLGITVGLSLPGELAVSWVEELYRGITACLQVYPTPIVGGDICRSTVVSIAITALGEVLPQKAILRSVAQPGYGILVTGLHGLSKAGLELLQNTSLGKKLSSQERTRLLQAHQRPKPRLDLLEYLESIPDHIAIAGMDSSDGLADAIQQICLASRVGAIIESEKLSIFSGLSKLVTQDRAREWLLYGGEDFELVLCLPLNWAASLLSKLASEAQIIGKIVSQPGIQIVEGNSKSQQRLNLSKGFQHFENL